MVPHDRRFVLDPAYPAKTTIPSLHLVNRDMIVIVNVTRGKMCSDLRFECRVSVLTVSWSALSNMDHGTIGLQQDPALWRPVPRLKPWRINYE